MSKKALLSLSDKTGVLEFAKELKELGYEIISTGGTFSYLSENGVAVTPIQDVTGFPEIMNGRVKTLHPKIHGALLALRDNDSHIAQAKENAIEFIDLVAVNLYPFEATIANPNVTMEDAIENIDIGGPTMIRSAAKNHKFVTVVVDPADYNKVIAEIKENGDTTLALRQELAIKVYAHTSKYDGEIQKFLADKILEEKREKITLEKGTVLRYGENSHQNALFFAKEGVEEANLGDIEIYHGKELSYNNFVDAEAALEVVKDYTTAPAVSVIKHTNPCGFATGTTLDEAFDMAWEGDIVSAFGSVIAFNTNVDYATASKLEGKFVEVVIAPSYDDDALEFLKNKSKNLRVIKVNGDYAKRDNNTTLKSIVGGYLLQSRDIELWNKFDTVTKKEFPKNKLELAKFTWIATKHTKSNAIVLGFEYEEGKFMVVGMGAGQPNRIDSLRKISSTKATENFTRLYEETSLFKEKFATVEEFISWAFGEVVLGSDAFFPFADTIEVCHGLGIKYIVQPGGSIRDEDVIAECDKSDIAMVFTNTRHFRH